MVAYDSDDESRRRRIFTMATAVSSPTGTFLSSVRPFRREIGQQEHSVWRLPPNHVIDLRDVTRGVEETDAGVCCKYLIDTMLGAGHSDIDSDGYMHHLDDVERFCDQNHIWEHEEVASWRDRIKRCRRAFQRMHHQGHHKHVSVLHVVYGYPDPMTRDFPKKVLDNLGELASLARYTDVVEVRRQEMARIEATAVSNRKVVIEPTKDLPTHWKGTKDEITEDDDRFQTGDEISRVAMRQNLPVHSVPFLADAIRHREQYERALRVISSSDALRATLAPASEQQSDEPDEHYDQRLVNTESKRDLFLVQLKIESTKMLEIASLVYHRAWLESAV